jgi:hypothetical protein
VFLDSVLIATLEMIIMTVAVAALVSRRPVTTWGPLRTGLVAAAALINMHLFPVMAWHTIDGITLVACGWWALDGGLRSGSAWPRRLGLLALGAAALCKQSFAPALLVGLVLLFAHPALRGTERRWGRALLDVATLLAAPLLYLAVVTVAGGLTDMFDQLTGAAPTYGRYLLLGGGDTRVLWLVLMFGAVALGAAALREWRIPTGVWARRTVTVGAVGVIAFVIVDGGLVGSGDWGITLWWALAITVVLHGLLHRSMPWRLCGLLLLGWMTSLSWGYDTPNLLGGSLALAAAGTLVSWVPWPVMRSTARWAVGSGLGLAVVVAAGMFLVVRHDADPYRDLPRRNLTATLGKVAPAMRGIVTNSSVYIYTSQIATCVQHYPAAAVAVLPDNPFIYPALGLRNPFPLDWPLPTELVGNAPARMLATAERLNRTGGYLVLFETVDSGQLATGQPVPAIPAGPMVDFQGVERHIQERLHGEPIRCGSFVGVWAL